MCPLYEKVLAGGFIIPAVSREFQFLNMRRQQIAGAWTPDRRFRGHKASRVKLSPLPSRSPILSKSICCQIRTQNPAAANVALTANCNPPYLPGRLKILNSRVECRHAECRFR